MNPLLSLLGLSIMRVICQCQLKKCPVPIISNPLCISKCVDLMITVLIFATYPFSSSSGMCLDYYDCKVCSMCSQSAVSRPNCTSIVISGLVHSTIMRYLDGFCMFIICPSGCNKLDALWGLEVDYALKQAIKISGNAL